jgi:hypothetical protein
VTDEVIDDMLSAGIVDPVKMPRSAVENAVSAAAAILLTTEAAIAEIPEPKMAHPAAFESCDEVWMLVCDPAVLLAKDHAKFLRELLQLPGRVVFHTAHPGEEEQLQRFLGREAIAAMGDRLEFATDDAVESMGTILIAEPHGSKRVYFLSPSGFLFHPRMRGDAMVFLLKERAKMTSLQHLLLD